MPEISIKQGLFAVANEICQCEMLVDDGDIRYKWENSADYDPGLAIYGAFLLQVDDSVEVSSAIMVIRQGEAEYRIPIARSSKEEEFENPICQMVLAGFRQYRPTWPPMPKIPSTRKMPRGRQPQPYTPRRRGH